MNLRAILAVALVVSVISTSNAFACACGVTCAVVKQTSDGFVALRSEPNTNSKMIMRLKPYDIVAWEWCDCPGNRMEDPWREIVCVSRLNDGQCDANSVHGWAYSKLLETAWCPSFPDGWGVLP